MISLGGRKAAAALGVILAGAVTVYFKGDVPPKFLELLSWVFTAFAGANAAEHLAGALKKPAQSPPGAVAEAVSKEVLFSMEERVTNLEQAVATSQQGLKAIVDHLSVKKPVADQADKNRQALGKL